MGLTKPRASQIFNLDYKQATRVVTVTNVTLAGGAPAMVDGVTLSDNDRVLVTGQGTASQNGLYIVSDAGTGSDGTWNRTSDGNETGEIEAGMIVMVTEGMVYADTQWKLITDDPITIGSTGLTFTQNYSANSISSGTSNVTVISSGNVTISSAGTANVLTVTSTGAVVSGTASITGNVDAGNVLTGGSVSATGNVTGGNLITTGTFESASISAVGNISGGNIATVGTANLATIEGSTASITGNVTAGNISTGGNIDTSGAISATGNITSGNVSATNITGTITTAEQTNITSIGTLGNLSVSGNTTSGNVLTGGEISATGNITGGNVSATNITGTITTAEQPNITTVGTLGNLSVTGNIIGGNISGNGRGVVGLTLTANNFSDVSVDLPETNQVLTYDGNIWINGPAATPTASVTGVGYFLATPVITAKSDNNTFELDTLTSIPVTTSATVVTSDYVTANTSTPIAAWTTTALGRTTIDAGDWTYGIWANVNYVQANTTSTMDVTTYSATPFAVGNVSTTGTGNTRTAYASEGGPFNGTTVNSSYLQTPRGLYKITAQFSPAQCTIATPTGYTNETAVAATVWNPLFTVTTTALTTSLREQIITTTQGEYTVAATAGLGLIASGYSTAGGRQFNIAFNGTTQSSGFSTPLTELHNDLAALQGGNTAEYYHLTAAEYTGTGNGVFVRATDPVLTTPDIGAATGTSVSVTGNITGGNLSGTNITGTLATASQTNITSVGTLSSLSVSGNTTSGNIITAGSVNATGNINTGGNVLITGIVSAVGNITGNYILGNGSQLSGIITTVANINNGTSNVAIAAANANVTVSVDGTSNVAVFATTGAYITGIVSALGNVTGGNVLTGGEVSAVGNLTAGNISATNLTGTLVTATQTNITSVGTLGSLSVTGNVTGGNLISTGKVYASDIVNIGTGIYLAPGPSGYINFFTSTGDRVSITDTGNISAVGNITGSNILTGGIVSATGNVTGNYFIGNGSQLSGIITTVDANTLTGNTLAANVVNSSLTSVGTLTSASVSGNTTSGNILSGGVVSATGNVTGNYFIGNGSQLTGVVASSGAGNLWVIGRTATFYVPIVSGILTIVGRTGNISVAINS